VIKLLLAKLLEFEVRATSPNNQNWNNQGVMVEDDVMKAIEKVGFNDTKTDKKGLNFCSQIDMSYCPDFGRRNLLALKSATPTTIQSFRVSSRIPVF
jgi:hypothetical protein